MLKRTVNITLAALVAFGLAACGGAGDQPEATDSGTPAGVVTNENGVQTITIRPVGNEMRYETTEFAVQAGQEVRIIFENTATSEAMHHNVVIVDSRDDVDRVGNSALEAGPAADYIPEDDAIVAYTAMAAPGETVEVTFTAPSEAGDYPYLCTYPGHYMLMQGTMTVTN